MTIFSRVMHTIPTLATKKEMAEAVRLSLRTLEKLEKERKIRSVRVGGRVLYDPAEVIADLKKLSR